MDKAFVNGFLREFSKLAAKKPKPWHHKLPGKGAATFAMRAAPLVALGSVPLGVAAMGMGKGLKTPATQAMPWEERY